MEGNLTNFQISEIQRVLERWRERVPVTVLSIKTEIISKNITDVTIKHWNTDHKNFLVIITHYSVHTGYTEIKNSTLEIVKLLKDHPSAIPCYL